MRIAGPCRSRHLLGREGKGGGGGKGEVARVGQDPIRGCFNLRCHWHVLVWSMQLQGPLVWAYVTTEFGALGK